MAESSKIKVIPRKKHKMMCRATIEQIEANNQRMSIIDFSESSLFSMKTGEYLGLLSNALVKNTVVKELYLEKISIANHDAEHIHKIVSGNKSITKLSLARNKFDGELAIEFARALAVNDTLIHVDFTGIDFNDHALNAFLDAFNSNITLRKIIWRLDSRISFRLTKCITRNNNIFRLKSAGREYKHLLPTGFESRPAEFLKVQTAPVARVEVATEEEEEVLSSPDYDANKEEKEDNTTKDTGEADEDKADAAASPEAPAADASESKAVEAGASEPSEVASETSEKVEPATEIKTMKSPLDRIKGREGRSQSEIGTSSTRPSSMSSRKSMWETRSRGASKAGPKKKKMLPRAVIAKIRENDPTIVDVNFDNSSLFSAKAAEYCKLLYEAMKSNTHVKSISAKYCGIGDSETEQIANIIAETETVTKIDLSNNRIKADGGVAIATSLEKNSSITELNLLKIQLGEGSLTKFLNMFDHNITLRKIVWRLDSRLSFRLNRALTRNKEILRRRNAGKSYFHLLPNKFREMEEHKQTTVLNDDMRAEPG